RIIPDYASVATSSASLFFFLRYGDPRFLHSFPTRRSSDLSIYYDTLTAEKSPVEFDVTDKERIYFNIGHAPDLTIMINGVEVEYPVDPNENVVQKIWININEDS